ncbi:MAG: outer membrane lipoprotein-sorting protein [Treponema sp.]|jgi:outer membrane lipoprotein-sorting protein|nr:outer membrane lipoprotein-sorting protein [Treponema sp.]
MKRITPFMLVLVLTAAAAAAQNNPNAVSIVEASRNRSNAQTTSTRARMVITARGGGTTERNIDQYSKDGPNGSRTVIVFQSPASVRGTRFLTMKNAAGGTDQWIFLPSLGKVRRIASSESGGNFMGTDMSYDDIASTSRVVNDDTHSMLREETLEDEDAACYVIQSIPRDSSYQYSKMISWIDKNTYAVRKMELYDRRGVLAKVMEASQFENIQGQMTARVSRMSTVSAGTSTTLYIDILKYDDPIPEGVFTTAYLETGRAR